MDHDNAGKVLGLASVKATQEVSGKSNILHANQRNA
jgi:hypothetical protein